MPTSKTRITITVTGQIERDLKIIWTAYPNLEGSTIETIALLLTLKASEILTGNTATVPRQLVEPTPEKEVPPDEVKTESADPISDSSDESEWQD